MAEDRPVLDQINLVVGDMAKMSAFYQRLGMEVPPVEPPWDQHHVSVEAGGGLDLELDSATSASLWNQSWPTGQAGVVIGFRVTGRERVDALYADLTGAGYAGQQEPHDAFWGSRYAVVTDPDGNAVGLMSGRDPAKSWDPPLPS